MSVEVRSTPRLLTDARKLSPEVDVQVIVNNMVDFADYNLFDLNHIIIFYFVFIK